MSKPRQVSFTDSYSPTLCDTIVEPKPSVNACTSALIQYGYHTADGKKTFKFWMLVLAFSITVILTALDMTMISTALPSIVQALPLSQISGGWITSAYLLTMTAFQPLFGGLSCVIGRRWSFVLAILLFIGGSVLCALSKSVMMLVIGRGLQGVGGGGIQAVGEISVSDITTLRERGFFVGIFGLVFAVSSFVAPVLGGAFSNSNWRWIFWINVPVGVTALMMVIPAMNLPVPAMPLKTKVAKMDLLGNLVLVGSIVGLLIGITEGGITHPWSHPKIYIPFVLGLLGFFIFLAIEFIPSPLARQPVLPLRLFRSRTACSAFLQTFVHGIVTYGAVYALPLYFQAVKDQKPLKSAVSTFPSTAPTASLAILAGVIMAITGRYKALTFIGWALAVAGFGWMTRFQAHTHSYELILAQILSGMGLGILFGITLPPIQASLPIEELESATAAYAFCRSFGSIWGIAITTSVLTATISSKLQSFPESAAYGLTGATSLGFVENIKLLPAPIRERVRQIYADGLQKAFVIFLPLTILGFLSAFALKDLPLPDFIGDKPQEKQDPDDGVTSDTLSYPVQSKRIQTEDTVDEVIIMYDRPDIYEKQISMDESARHTLDLLAHRFQPQTSTDSQLTVASYVTATAVRTGFF